MKAPSPVPRTAPAVNVNVPPAQTELGEAERDATVGSAFIVIVVLAEIKGPTEPHPAAAF